MVFFFAQLLPPLSVLYFIFRPMFMRGHFLVLNHYLFIHPLQIYLNMIIVIHINFVFGALLKLLVCFSIFVLSLPVSWANDCNEVKSFIQQNFDRKTSSEFEFYRCKMVNEEFGQIFDEDVSRPGSIEVVGSNACLALYKEGGGRILVQDKVSGFELLTRNNFGNGNSGNKIFTAIKHDEEESTITRVDFDKERVLGHLTKWKVGIFRNKMLYNYEVKCQRL